MTVVGTGDQKRDFTFIDDVVSANIKAAYSNVNHGIYNVGTGKNYSINDIVEMICNDCNIKNVLLTRLS